MCMQQVLYRLIGCLQGVDADLDQYYHDAGSCGRGVEGHVADGRVRSPDLPPAILFPAVATRCPHHRSARLHDHSRMRKFFENHINPVMLVLIGKPSGSTLR